MRKINVGLIGYGLAGRVFHEPVISSVEGLNINKIYETNSERIQVLKTKYEESKLTTNVDEIFNDENIQLVVLAVPNGAHFDLAKRALCKGKHVVVEKPFTITSDEADKLIKLAKEKDRVLTVNQNRRWDSDFKTVKKVISGGLLGDIVEYEAHYDRFRNYFKENSWRETDEKGSGILYDLGSHLIDQAQCLFGVPDEIFADVRIQRQGGKATDNFELLLKYPNIKVTLKSGMLVRELGPHFNLLGTKGSFVKYGMDVQEQYLGEGYIPKEIKDWGKENENTWGTINTQINDLHVIGKIESELGDYREFYKNVYKSILKEEDIIVTPEQARNTIRIIELAEESSNKKIWVKFTD